MITEPRANGQYTHILIERGLVRGANFAIARGFAKLVRCGQCDKRIDACECEEEE